MKIRLLSLALLLASLHGAAHAGLIKCKKPGGGFTLQDTPCAPDTSKPEAKRPVVGEKDPAFAQKSRPGANWERREPFVMERPLPARQAWAPEPAAPVPARPVNVSRAQRQINSGSPPQGDYLARRAEEEREAHNRLAMAHNRMIMCNSARQQLEVVNTHRPISSLDNRGERNYVDDKDRAGVQAEARRNVASACN